MSVHVTPPEGAEAPLTPLTTAVNTMVSPKLGDVGATEIAIEALDLPTVIDTGVVAPPRKSSVCDVSTVGDSGGVYPGCWSSYNAVIDCRT